MRDEGEGKREEKKIGRLKIVLKRVKRGDQRGLPTKRKGKSECLV